MPAQVPFSFAPTSITEWRATLVVSCAERGIAWSYPVRGIAESVPSDKPLIVRCQARGSYRERISLVLPGLPSALAPDDAFVHSLSFASPEVAALAMRTLSITPLNPRGALATATSPLEFDVTFEPLRPFSAVAEFIVTKASGGRWRCARAMIICMSRMGARVAICLRALIRFSIWAASCKCANPLYVT